MENMEYVKIAEMAFCAGFGAAFGVWVATSVRDVGITIIAFTIDAAATIIASVVHLSFQKPKGH